MPCVLFYTSVRTAFQLVITDLNSSDTRGSNQIISIDQIYTSFKCVNQFWFNPGIIFLESNFAL